MNEEIDTQFLVNKNEIEVIDNIQYFSIIDIGGTKMIKCNICEQVVSEIKLFRNMNDLVSHLLIDETHYHFPIMHQFVRVKLLELNQLRENNSENDNDKTNS